ncbi:Fibronectin-binding protein A domain protein [Synechococcus sp. PCC 7335]|uniref:Rqc2 family fibronectin-binding protein n=1 Tax=Synechococcus sp. (strain ATCC 29403 / PCC 7335) TaxID=91464 RepID=UPI00017EE010|nr:NFACT family protein [Synechococcus sp. PCC 7335]EDX85158.1 Fibronectin-binding protein A domain protein [Synechococcus sp. PCC 7335]
MQPVDYTTLSAARAGLRAHWLPARCEQVYQRDQYTLFIALRTIEEKGWLAISWHPQAARIHMASPPPRQPDTFTFSQQLKHQLGGLALTQINVLSPWERVLDLQFAQRPDEPALWHLYVEIMGKYSNVILTTADKLIVTAAHQVSEQRSSVRPIQTGRPYVHPPRIRGKLPSLAEGFEDWRDRISLIPGKLKKMLVKASSGVSSSVATQLIWSADLSVDIRTSELTEDNWQRLFKAWQHWLSCLSTETFAAATIETGGYTVLSDLLVNSDQVVLYPVQNEQTLLEDYYRYQFNQEAFRRLHHQLSQTLRHRQAKLKQKANTFTARLQQSDQAEAYRRQADLLMAHLSKWQVGMSEIELRDFDSDQPVVISLNPEKNAVQNAQALYKKHQKLKRSRIAIMPLLAEVKAEIDYLNQVEDSLLQVPAYQSEADLKALEETYLELIAQGYLRDTSGRSPSTQAAQAKSRHREDIVDFRRYTVPQGLEILIGRNNSQNEQLTFKQASDYDLWFHAQEIPGSHVLLRLNAGEVPTDETLQLAASFAAYYSRARQSDQVPVVYTEPKNVYKPKGALPGMVIYKHEQVLWGQPQQALDFMSK